VYIHQALSTCARLRRGIALIRLVGQVERDAARPRAPLGPRSVLAHKAAEIGPEAWIAAAQADAKLHERRNRATAWVARGQSP
jgi:hypothetical protein